MVFERVAPLVHIPTEAVTLEGLLVIPAMAQGMVLFAHGSGSSRHSPRNIYVAQILQHGGFGTLLLSLETPAEAGAHGPACGGGAHPRLRCWRAPSAMPPRRP
jgi:hypothetical protein